MWNDGDLSSNGESLYRPTLGPYFPIFPHSPDHQSASIKDLSDDPCRFLSNSDDRPTGPDQSPVIVFHLHQTHRYYFDHPHTPYKSFPQMITLLLTTHSPFVLPLFHLHHVSATHSFLSHFPYLSPFCFSPCRSDTKSVHSACPKPFPLYSGSILPVFP